MNNIENLKNECLTIEDNARHTAEAHYLLAGRSQCMATMFEIIPAVAASLSGLLVVGQVIPAWWGWITLVASVITATSSIISPQKSYYENLNAAKSFTVVKNKAQALRKSFATLYTEEELFKEVKTLSEYYNQLILFTPPTQDWAYKKAVEEIKNRIAD